MVDKSGTVISSSPATQSEADSQHVQETPPRKTSRFKWFLGLFWDTYNGDTRERKYVQKVDIFLLYVSDDNTMHAVDGSTLIMQQFIYHARILYQVSGPTKLL